MMLFDFDDANAIQRWQAIDDRVMGGASQSEMVQAPSPMTSMALFRGSVSDRNNGGFCSVRATLDSPISDVAEHLSIHCQNSPQWGSKFYYLTVRINNDFDGISYRTTLTPNERLSSHEFTATEFAPVWRGRPVADAPPLALSAVQQIGLMIADSQLGQFELIIRKISAF